MTWTAQLHHDGTAVTGNVPIDLWDVGTIAAPLLAAVTGGPVSIANAVHATRETEAPRDPDIFDALAALG